GVGGGGKSAGAAPQPSPSLGGPPPPPRRSWSGWRPWPSRLRPAPRRWSEGRGWRARSVRALAPVADAEALGRVDHGHPHLAEDVEPEALHLLVRALELELRFE